MKELSSTIEIDASADRVWQVLMDFASFAEWNPYLPSIEGKPEAQERLKVRIEPPDGMGMTMSPTVIKAEPGAEFRWLGHLLFPGLFDGEHYFEIEPVGEGSVRFKQGEKFTGVLVPIFGLMGIYKRTEAGFEAMNQALKKRVEGPGD